MKERPYPARWAGYTPEERERLWAAYDRGETDMMRHIRYGAWIITVFILLGIGAAYLAGY